MCLQFGRDFTIINIDSVQRDFFLRARKQEYKEVGSLLGAAQLQILFLCLCLELLWLDSCFGIFLTVKRP